MDPEIQELKELVRQSIALSQENNKILRSMRRASWMSAIFKLLWMGVVVVLLVVVYSYLWPYLEQVLELYKSIPQLAEQARQFGSTFGPQQ